MTTKSAKPLRSRFTRAGATRFITAASDRLTSTRVDRRHRQVKPQGVNETKQNIKDSCAVTKIFTRVSESPLFATWCWQILS